MAASCASRRSVSGEVLGAIGVIVTLAYLAVQIRQNTRAMEATALVSVHDIHALTYENDRYIGWLFKDLPEWNLRPDAIGGVWPIGVR